MPGADADDAQRLAREPYRTLLARIVSQTDSALGWDLDDDSIPAEREKSKAAKNLAFLYALDRTVVAGAVVPFPTPAARAAAGDRVRDYLLAMYTVSRIADTFDDDINTSEEIVSYATAYDTLVGAGHPLSPEDDAAIRANLITLTSDLYADYLGLDPVVGTQTVFLTNNHRTKSGAALALAGIALAEHTPDPGTDPIGLTEPANWVAYGIAQVDRVLRHAYLTGDGAYSEGPYYARYSGQNHLPLLFAVDRLVGGVEGPVFGLPQPNLWRHPLFARHQRWMLDMTLPDGSMAHIDDGTVARSYYYGMLSSFAEAPFYRWAWESGVQPIVSEGSVDLAADQIVAFDDAIAAAEPTGSPTSFYVEGGNAIFRADWSREAIMAVALGEHGIANEFARDELGRGIPAAASHEQAEPGAYQLWAFGEQMAIDPGYFTFETRSLVAQPQHHNVVLVDGRGPGDPFTATLRWADRDAEPPTDGQSTISRTLDSGFVDAATVTSSYGGTLPGTAGSTPRALFERRFVFADDRYLLLADRITSSRSRAYQWLLHGNGGPGSDGLFDATPLGGTWTLRGARLSGAIGFDVGATRLLEHDGATRDREPRGALAHRAARHDERGARARVDAARADAERRRRARDRAGRGGRRRGVPLHGCRRGSRRARAAPHARPRGDRDRRGVERRQRLELRRPRRRHAASRVRRRREGAALERRDARRGGVSRPARDPARGGARGGRRRDRGRAGPRGGARVRAARGRRRVRIRCDVRRRTRRAEPQSRLHAARRRGQLGAGSRRRCSAAARGRRRQHRARRQRELRSRRRSADAALGPGLGAGRQRVVARRRGRLGADAARGSPRSVPRAARRHRRTRCGEPPRRSRRARGHALH